MEHNTTQTENLGIYAGIHCTECGETGESVAESGFADAFCCEVYGLPDIEGKDYDIPNDWEPDWNHESHIVRDTREGLRVKYGHTRGY